MYSFFETVGTRFRELALSAKVWHIGTIQRKLKKEKIQYRCIKIKKT